jgi:hypothetical protein
MLCILYSSMKAAMHWPVLKKYAATVLNANNTCLKNGFSKVLR